MEEYQKNELKINNTKNIINQMALLENKVINIIQYENEELQQIKKLNDSITSNLHIINKNYMPSNAL